MRAWFPFAADEGRGCPGRRREAKLRRLPRARRLVRRSDNIAEHLEEASCDDTSSTRLIPPSYPAKAGIQYAAALEIASIPGITGSSAFADDDVPGVEEA